MTLGNGRSNWEGEICTKCKRDQRIAWTIRDDKWNIIVPPEDKNRVFCFECFLTLADEKGVEIKVDDFLFFAWVGMNTKGDTLIDRG